MCRRRFGGMHVPQKPPVLERKRPESRWHSPHCRQSGAAYQVSKVATKVARSRLCRGVGRHRDGRAETTATRARAGATLRRAPAAITRIRDEGHVKPRPAARVRHGYFAALRLRREADKYLSLIETIGFLHQKQRPVKRFGPKQIPYIEVTVADIDRANRLTVKCLARALSGLPGPTQELLIKIRNHVVKKADGRNLLDVRFNRGDMRDATGWTSDRQMLGALETLIEREYIHGVSGSFGKEYIYILGPDHRLVVQPELPIERQILELGLTPAENLVDPETLSRSDLHTP